MVWLRVSHRLSCALDLSISATIREKRYLNRDEFD